MKSWPVQKFIQREAWTIPIHINLRDLQTAQNTSKWKHKHHLTNPSSVSSTSFPARRTVPRTTGTSSPARPTPSLHRSSVHTCKDRRARVREHRSRRSFASPWRSSSKSLSISWHQRKTSSSVGSPRPCQILHRSSRRRRTFVQTARFSGDCCTSWRCRAAGTSRMAASGAWGCRPLEMEKGEWCLCGACVEVFYREFVEGCAGSFC